MRHNFIANNIQKFQLDKLIVKYTIIRIINIILSKKKKASLKKLLFILAW